MLSKLIRYEWKAVARVCIPMYGGLILAAMLTHFLLGNLERFSSTLYDIITMAMSTLCFGLFMAAFVLTLIIQIQRFSKNLLGDEGYLMFTLPASVSQHITAKLVVAVLLDVLSVAAAILAVLALALDGTMWLDLPGDFFDMIVYVDWSDWLCSSCVWPPAPWACCTSMPALRWATWPGSTVPWQPSAPILALQWR